MKACGRGFKSPQLHHLELSTPTANVSARSGTHSLCRWRSFSHGISCAASEGRQHGLELLGVCFSRTGTGRPVPQGPCQASVASCFLRRSSPRLGHRSWPAARLRALVSLRLGESSNLRGSAERVEAMGASSSGHSKTALHSCTGWDAPDAIARLLERSLASYAKSLCLAVWEGIGLLMGTVGARGLNAVA